MNANFDINTNRQALLWRCVAAASGALWLALSAYGGHHTSELLEVTYFAKAGRHQIVHTLLIFWLSLLPLSSLRTAVCALSTLGLLCFSGTLYLLSFFALPGLTWLVPVGGVSFLLAWLLLLLDSLKEFFRHKA